MTVRKAYRTLHPLTNAPVEAAGDRAAEAIGVPPVDGSDGPVEGSQG